MAHPQGQDVPTTATQSVTRDTLHVTHVVPGVGVQHPHHQPQHVGAAAGDGGGQGGVQAPGHSQDASNVTLLTCLHLARSSTKMELERSQMTILCGDTDMHCTGTRVTTLLSRVTCHALLPRVTVMCSLLWTTRITAPVSWLQILRVASWLQEITSPAPVSCTPVTWGYTQCCHSAGGDIVRILSRPPSSCGRPARASPRPRGSTAAPSCPRCPWPPAGRGPPRRSPGQSGLAGG